MKRKIIMQDPAVRAAIDALKAAVLAVNGDETVVSFLAFVDIRHADGRHGSLATDADICPCPKCLTRLRNEFFDILNGALQSQTSKGTVH